MESGISFKDLIFKHWYNSNYDQWLVLDEKVQPDNRKYFIEVCKEIIQFDMLKGIGRQLEFSNDYKKVRVIRHYNF